ncbi:YSC84-related protein [Thermodesulfobacteriota bacterium]
METRRNQQIRCRIMILAVSAAVILTGLIPGAAFGKTAREIDVSVDVALERFNRQVQGGEEFAKSATGILVMPGVTKGAFIIGAQYGEGALRVGGVTVDYYSLAAGSIGLQIGGERKDIIIMFMTDEALKKFRESKGWEAGVDGSIAFHDSGTSGSLSTQTAKDPIVGFIFDTKGFIADLSLKGAKFTKLDR